MVGLRGIRAGSLRRFLTTMVLGVGTAAGCGTVPFRLDAIPLPFGEGAAPQAPSARPADPPHRKPLEGKGNGDECERHPYRWQQKLKAKYA